MIFAKEWQTIKQIKMVDVKFTNNIGEVLKWGETRLIP